MNKLNLYQNYCETRRRSNQFRVLRETVITHDGHAERNGQNLTNFASNDYLGLSQHPLLIEKSKEYTEKYGAGSTASRLITGNHPVYTKIEKSLAESKGCESALILCSGYQANFSVLAALADADVISRPVTILADRLCHNSLLQGALLSGARLARFRHNDYAHLEELLKQQQEKNAFVIIVTESVFGMDGDRADLKKLVELAQKYDAMSYVDEAHATGLFGTNGFGLAAEYKGAIDIVMGTFGKALGSFGAYIACKAQLRDYLIQRCGGLIYSTGLPPSVLGSIEAAIELLPKLNQERAYLAEQSTRLRSALIKQDWDCGDSTTHIIPVILGGEEAATTLAELLKKNGILVPAIRPPTVPRGTSRLRISISAAHKASDIDKLIDAMALAAPTFHQSLAS